MDKIRTCQKCVNWIEEDDGSLSCDFEHFVNSTYTSGILYVPGMFDCDNFEWDWKYVDNR